MLSPESTRFRAFLFRVLLFDYNERQRRLSFTEEFMQKRYVIGSAAALSALISATPAHAEEPFTANKLQIGGGLNYGLYMGDDEGDPPNPYGLGLGVDLGYTLGLGVYLGGEFNYFFGGSKEESGIEVATNIMQYGAEVGYDIGLSPELVIRPKLGIGMGSAKA